MATHATHDATMISKCKERLNQQHVPTGKRAKTTGEWIGSIQLFGIRL